MRKTREYQALLEACSQEGCPICRLALEGTRRYLGSWKYDLFTDVSIREELRRTQGFCHRHTWQLAEMGAHLPLAQAYRDIVTDVIDQLKRGNDSAPPASGGLLRRIFDSRREQVLCPACQQQAKAEGHYIHTLRKSLLDEAFYQHMQTSDGLCLDHYRLACELKLPDTPGGDWQSLLRKVQLACLQRLDEQIGEMIRKYDYRFKDEIRGSEMISWKRAAGLIAGEEDRS
jgi:hypothetical protein